MGILNDGPANCPPHRYGPFLRPGHPAQGRAPVGDRAGRGAPYAGVFEISVVAGLITVLFILTIALTRKGDEVRESRLANWVFPLAFVAFVIIDALVMKGLIGKIPALAGGTETGTFGDILWKGRTLDLVGQIAVILAGVFAVLALFRKRDNHD